MALRPPAFSRAQVDRYFDRIGLPGNKRQYNVSAISDEDKVFFLGLLHKHHLCSVPFENLSLHYSQHHVVELHPPELYTKIVESRGRGGYCMETNLLLACLLRAVGYEIYSAGAKVFRGPDLGYSGWSHMVNFVVIGGRKYWVDAGYGSNVPVLPVKLPDRSHTAVAPNISPSSLRLQYRMPDGYTDSATRMWCYAIRINDESPWQEQYAFTELEFTPADFVVMNLCTSTAPETWFKQQIICCKMLMDTNGEIDGVVILQDNVKVRKHGEIVLRKDFKTEEERLAALEEYFDIVFSPAEKDGIRGLTTELKMNRTASVMD